MKVFARRSDQQRRVTNLISRRSLVLPKLTANAFVREILFVV
ncbi:MAG: hypothetical protein WBG70_21305 [Spirulinaceae cyanobacterium]